MVNKLWILHSLLSIFGYVHYLGGQRSSVEPGRCKWGWDWTPLDSAFYVTLNFPDLWNSFSCSSDPHKIFYLLVPNTGSLRLFAKQGSHSEFVPTIFSSPQSLKLLLISDEWNKTEERHFDVWGLLNAIFISLICFAFDVFHYVVKSHWIVSSIRHCDQIWYHLQRTILRANLLNFTGIVKRD